MYDDLIRRVERQLRSNPDIHMRTELLEKSMPKLQAVLENPAQDSARVWDFIHQSGLFDLLMSCLKEPFDDLPVFGRFLAMGLKFTNTCVAFGARSYNNINHPLKTSTSICSIFSSPVKSTIQLLDAKGPASQDLTIMLQQSAILLLTTALPFFGNRENFGAIFDAGTLLQLVLAVTFGPQPRSRASRKEPASMCAQLVAAYPYDDTVAYPEVEYALRRYSYNWIASRCVEICSYSYDGPFPVGFLDLFVLLHHSDFPAMQGAFCRRGVYGAILQSQWEFLRTEEHSGTLSKHPEVHTMLIMVRLLSTLFTSRTATTLCSLATSDLIKEQDLFLFLGKVLVAPMLISSKIDLQRRAIEEAFRRWGDFIESACETNPDLKDGLCRTEWAHVMQQLLVLQRSNLDARPETAVPYTRYSFAVHVWRELGQQLEVMDLAPTAAEAGRTQPSCSWIMCPLHRSNGESGSTIEWEMLRCTGCGEAQYCGTPCQRRHWRSGHQAVCLTRLASTFTQ